jgi:S-formylglutathione hydrolase
MERIEHRACFGGWQDVYRHSSQVLGCEMNFAVYLPPQAERRACPVLYWLSGLTCTEDNFTVKSGVYEHAARHGIAIVAPDTSPRGEGVADDPAYDLGQGAGFYVDATQAPWSQHFRMRSYVEDELPALIAEQFPMADMGAQGITGHSMGGHGALTIALRNPDRYRAASAFSPIVAPSQVPWGIKALGGYLGDDKAAWRKHDAVALIEDGAHFSDLLVDYGDADQFLAEQLRPQLLQAACEKANIRLLLRRQEGYDHSYYFISTFMADHLRWHAARLGN